MPCVSWEVFYRECIIPAVDAAKRDPELNKWFDDYFKAHEKEFDALFVDKMTGADLGISDD